MLEASPRKKTAKPSLPSNLNTRNPRKLTNISLFKDIFTANKLVLECKTFPRLEAITVNLVCIKLQI